MITYAPIRQSKKPYLNCHFTYQPLLQMVANQESINNTTRLVEQDKCSDDWGHLNEGRSFKNDQVE